MDLAAVMDLVREAVGVAIKLASPLLILSMIVGVVVAIFQIGRASCRERVSSPV